MDSLQRSKSQCWTDYSTTWECCGHSQIGLSANFVIKEATALAGVAQWVGAPSHGQKVAGSIPSQSTSLGLGFDPQCRPIQEAAN